MSLGATIALGVLLALATLAAADTIIVWLLS
jgi:hypothetical protein